MDEARRLQPALASLPLPPPCPHPRKPRCRLARHSPRMKARRRLSCVACRPRWLPLHPLVAAGGASRVRATLCRSHPRRCPETLLPPATPASRGLEARPWPQFALRATHHEPSTPHRSVRPSVPVSVRCARARHLARRVHPPRHRARVWKRRTPQPRAWERARALPPVSRLYQEWPRVRCHPIPPQGVSSQPPGAWPWARGPSPCAACRTAG